MDAAHRGRTPLARLRPTLAAVFAWSALASAQSPPVPDAAPIEPRNNASVPPYVEYDKRVRASEQLSPLGGELFGEDVSLYTGATEFSHVDIDIPGNNALPVQLRRRLSIGALVPDQAHDARGGPGNAFGGLGNWDIEVPYVYGTFDNLYGWGDPVGNTPRKPRCTDYYLPQAQQPNVSAKDIWSGNKVHIPGRGEKELLRLDATYPPLQYPTDGRAPTWTTSEFDAFTCLPNTPGNRGEGFVMTTPDGVTYTFDVYRERAYAPVEVNGNSNLRKAVYLLASVVADRYGNTVTYTYDDVGRPTRISGSDGNREIRLTYDATIRRLLTSASVTVAIPGQSTQTRTWTYAYQNGADGLPRLSTVTLPDNVSQWVFDYTTLTPGDSYLYVNYIPPKPSGQECASATFQTAEFGLRITHPSGATGDFQFGMGRQARTVPQPNCPPGGGAFYKTAYVDTYSLKSKTISEANSAPSTWTYVPGGSCTRCTTTVVTQPDGGKVTYRFSNVYAATQAGTTPTGSAIEGQLLETVTRDENNAELRKVVNTYVTGVDTNGVPMTGYPFPSRYGGGSGGDDPASGSVRPLKSVATTQQGVTFTKIHKRFDPLARPLEVEKTSTLGTKTETTVYRDDKDRWILGLVETVSNAALTSTTVVDNDYDALGNLTQVQSFGRIDRQMTWNADGTLASITEGPNTTTLGSFKRGVPQSVTYADNRTRSATIDDAGDIRSVTNEVNETTRYDYDALRRLTSITYPANDTVSWYPTTIQYERVGTDTSVGVSGTHWKQTTTTGRARKVTHYDQRLRPVVTSEMDLDVPSTQRHVRRKYDYAGRDIFASYPSASATANAGTTTTYDALGRVTGTSQTSELGTLTTSTNYDQGFKTRFVNARDKTTTTAFQAFDEPDDSAPVEIAAPLGVTTSIGRDVFGKPTSLTRSDPTISATRTYVYDENQRLCKTIEPESGTTVQAYNSANQIEWKATGQNLTSTTSCQQASVANSQKVGYTYDARNRLLQTNYGDNSPNVVRTYTADGLLETIASDNSRWTTTYNKRRLSTNETLRLDGVDYPIGYTHTRNGHVGGMTYPDGTALDYAPNALGEATKVGNYATQIVTHPNGALAGFVYGNGIVHTTQQNDRGLPSRSVDGNVLSDSYAYDANANVTGITDQLDNAFTRTMTYDDLDRLQTAASATWGTIPRTFSYDALDNLRSMASSGLNWTYDYNQQTQRLERIANTSGGAAFITYGYDARGRVTSRTVGVQAQTFTFDLADRVKQISPNVATYRYDGHGRRTAVTKGGTTTVQVYSQAGQLVYQSAPAIDGIFKNGFRPGDQNYAQNGGNTRYVYLGRHLIAEDGTLGRQYLHTDALGSPVRRTTASGTPTAARQNYEPYGWGPQALSTPGFTGHVADAETGLSYMQARYYDPFAGRFLAVDPVAASEGSFNRYWYGNNNPYRFVDPDGRAGTETFGESMAWGDVGYARQNTLSASDSIAVMKFTAEFLPGAAVGGCLLGGCSALSWAIAALDVVPGAGKVTALSIRAGIRGFGKQAAQQAATAGSSRAARREAMREAGIPTSQQPTSQSRNQSGREYSYEAPAEGGGIQQMSVQQQTMDVSHPGQAHWEAGAVKIDPLTGALRVNKYNRPMLKNGKSKVDY